MLFCVLCSSGKSIGYLGVGRGSRIRIRIRIRERFGFKVWWVKNIEE